MKILRLAFWSIFENGQNTFADTIRDKEFTLIPIINYLLLIGYAGLQQFESRSNGRAKFYNGSSPKMQLFKNKLKISRKGISE